jgi:GNAT superfamily N-acetyltransferase
VFESDTNHEHQIEVVHRVVTAPEAAGDGVTRLSARETADAYRDGPASMSALRDTSVELLADNVEFIPNIARWHFDEWGRTHSAVTAADVAAQLSTWANRDSIPLTYVAVERGVPLGSASLVVHDMSPPAPGCEDLTPWLSGVFVITESRGTGLGPALVGACEEAAARFGHAKVYLYTAARTAERFYTPMGWHMLDVVEYDGDQVTVMAKTLAM